MLKRALARSQRVVSLGGLLFECLLECASAAVGVQSDPGTRAQTLFIVGMSSHRYIHSHFRRFAALDALRQNSRWGRQVASGSGFTRCQNR